MRVLLVEDEALVREAVAEGLADDGLDVVEAPCGEDALILTEKVGPPEVLVTDVELGTGMSGLALAEEVQRRWPEAGVVIMTGTPSSVGHRCFGQRERFLAKPFGSARLVSAVRELMGRPGR